ncbi:MAG: amidohydrolase [bacterium]|nr:amidohydrolase [bacterium]
MNRLKETAIQTIDAAHNDLLNLSHDIHTNPELSLVEHKSVAFIGKVLHDKGFDFRLGVGGLDTAFIATKHGKKVGPHIAFLAEYDALPGIGHACGHNIIATCATGAFLGVSAVIDNLEGSISIIGTPGEEADGGKILLLDAGIFNDIDFALMMHPSSGRSLVGRGGRAATNISVDFIGKSAHSSVPNKGINALSAVISSFQNIDLLRPTLESEDNINGIVTHGGVAANVIPGEASCEFSLRARTLADLNNLVEKVKLAICSAEMLTGARAKVNVGIMYAERYSNIPMCTLFKDNMALLGEEVEWANPVGMYGSSDIGNISIELPIIHDYLWITPEGVNSHNSDFTQHSISMRADEVAIKGAKGLAMSAIDILSSADLQKEIKEFHRQQVPASYIAKQKRLD